MGREIKFRVWDKVEKRYRRIVRLNYDDGELVSITVYGPDDFAPTVLPLERVILEQSTGLKDKNGKEIYEGDIVAQELIDDPFAGGYPTYIVCWDEEFLGWALKDTTGDDGNDTDLHFFIAERRKCEIVGNIHENPELLEVEYGQE